MAKDFNYTMTMLKYIRLREACEIESIRKEYAMGDADVYTWELGYQCYLKKLPLDTAINVIQAYKI